MQYLITARLSPPGRSVQDEHGDISKNLIGAIFVAAMTCAVFCAVFCAVLDYSTTAAAGPEPKDDGWKTSEFQRREAAATVVIAEAMLRVE